MNRKILFSSVFVLLIAFTLAAFINRDKPRILVFSKTSGYRHEAISAGQLAIQKLGKTEKFDVDTTEEASVFTKKNLKKYEAVIFLLTTGDVLNTKQQGAFEKYIQDGGGFVGIHSATDTEYDWPWYNQLVGAYFESHPGNPNVRTATFEVIDPSHLATHRLPSKFNHEDEFHNFKSVQSDLINILVNIDENTYEGGTNGDNHPMIWYHDFDGGRSFYTGLGHTEASYSNVLFVDQLSGGILYAIGE